MSKERLMKFIINSKKVKMKINILTSPQVKKMLNEELNKMKIVEELDNLRERLIKLEEDLKIFWNEWNTHRERNLHQLTLKEKKLQ